MDAKDACPRGIRSELWLTDEEFQYISTCLKESGFQIERIEETPRKSTAMSVSQVSLKSGSNRSIGRQKSVVTSARLSAVHPVSLSNRGGLPESERNEYRRLVQLLIRTHKTASVPFLFPVPETVIGYYDVIKKPVDLTTIRQRLDSSSYLNRAEFEQDFLQMIWNAYIFNPPNSEVFRSALELHQAFVMGLQKSVIALNDQKQAEAYAKIDAAKKKRQQLVRRQSGTESAGKSRISTATLSRKSTTEEQLRKKLEYLQKVVSKQTVTASRKSSSPTVPQDRPLNERQLEQLADDLEQLDPRHVPQVANVLRGEPTARISDGQLDLSIHDLPPVKQRELLRLMEKIKAQDALRNRLGERVQDFSDDEYDAKRPRI
jgi:hypothetical protein